MVFDSKVIVVPSLNLAKFNSVNENEKDQNELEFAIIPIPIPITTNETPKSSYYSSYSSAPRIKADFYNSVFSTPRLTSFASLAERTKDYLEFKDIENNFGNKSKFQSSGSIGGSNERNRGRNRNFYTPREHQNSSSSSSASQIIRYPSSRPSTAPPKLKTSSSIYIIDRSHRDHDDLMKFAAFPSPPSNHGRCHPQLYEAWEQRQLRQMHHQQFIQNREYLQHKQHVQEKLQEEFCDKHLLMTNVNIKKDAKIADKLEREAAFREFREGKGDKRAETEKNSDEYYYTIPDAWVMTGHSINIQPQHALLGNLLNPPTGISAGSIGIGASTMIASGVSSVSIKPPPTRNHRLLHHQRIQREKLKEEKQKHEELIKQMNRLKASGEQIASEIENQINI